MKFIRRVYENGKVTIPKEIRELAGLKEGDFVELEVVGLVRRADDAAPPREP